MTTPSRLAVVAAALAVPLAIAAPAGGLLAAAAAPDAAPAGPVAPASPAGMVTLVDDTGVLTIDVPAAWTDVDTAPGTNDDGTPMAWISASTDFAAYRETFDVPGAVFVGVTHTTDLQSWIDRLGQDGPCAESVTEPYDDGAFVGLHATYSQCGPGGQATFHLVAANAGDDVTRTYVVQVQSANPADEAYVAPVLGSFNAVGITQPASDVTTSTVAQASVPTATTAGSAVTLPDGTPLVPATAPPPRADGTGDDTAEPGSTDLVDDAGQVFTPANSVVDGAVQVTDDSRAITVAVPPAWTSIVTAAAVNGDGSSAPQIIATPGDSAVFADPGLVPTDFTVPGIRFVARTFDADTAGLVTDAATVMPCDAGTPQPYSDPVFDGHIVELTGCGGTATRIYLVAANPADSAMTATLLIQVPDADETAFQTVLSSFDVASAG